METNKEELEKIKKKYKKIRNIVLTLILIIVVPIVLNITYKTIIVKRMYTVIGKTLLSKNYKMTQEFENSGTLESYIKDGKNKTVFRHKDDVTMISYNIEDTSYTFMENPKEGIKNYYKRELPLNYEETSEEEMLESMGCNKKGKFKISNALKIVLASKIKISNEEYKGTKCYKIKNDGEKYYSLVDKKTFEVIYQNEGERKIEYDVVTDEDMKLPNLEEYTFLENN